MAEVVARRIGAVLGELLGEPEIGRAVQAGDEAIDHGLGNQVEAGDGGERVGVEEALEHQVGSSGNSWRDPSRRGDAETRRSQTLR